MSPFTGVIVPVITPLTQSGALSRAGLDQMIDHIIAGGVHGILLLGTTGQTMSLSLDQRREIIAAGAVSMAGRCQLYIGITSKDIDETVGLTDLAHEHGADAVVAHLPVDCRMTPKDMIDHFRILAERCSLPLFIYNIPGLVGCSIAIPALEELSRIEAIAGLKDSQADQERQLQLARMFADRDDFAYFVGSTRFALVGMRNGARGFVPSCGNLIPRLCTQLYEQSSQGHWPEAQAVQDRLDAVSATYQSNHTIDEGVNCLKTALMITGLLTQDCLAGTSTLTEQEMRTSLAELQSL